MLNSFLVLGLVPGTNFVITFNEVAFMLWLAFLVGYIKLRFRVAHQPVEVVQLGHVHSFSYPIYPSRPPVGDVDDEIKTLYLRSLAAFKQALVEMSIWFYAVVREVSLLIQERRKSPKFRQLFSRKNRLAV